MAAEGSSHSKGRIPDGVVVTSYGGGLASRRHGKVREALEVLPVHRMTDMVSISS